MPKKPKVQIWQPVSVHEPDLERKGDLISEILPTDPPGFSKPWVEPQEALRKEVSNITVFDLADLTANQGRTIKFLQKMKLLHTRRACDSCDMLTWVYLAGGIMIGCSNATKEGLRNNASVWCLSK